MIIFWILAGGLLALALAFILAPLVQSAPPDDSMQQDALNLEVFRQRLKELDADLAAGSLDQERYAAARHDLERELLYDVDPEQTSPASRHASSVLGRWLLGGSLVIVLPLSAVLIYLDLGELDLVDPVQIAASSQGVSDANAEETASLEILVERLEARLQDDPENLEGWLMLGRTYFATDQLQKGLKAIERAYELAPDQSEIKLAYAEALAASSPTKSLEGRPAELIRAVLEQEPDNRIARWLAGMISFQQEQFQSAAVTWRKILEELDPQGEEAANLRQMVVEAETRAGIPTTDGQVEQEVPKPAEPERPAVSDTAQTPAEPATAPIATDAAVQEPAAPAPTAADATDASDVSLSVQVSLDPSLADQAAPEDTVFVFARAAAGPPMPLAVQRIQVRDLPKTLTLDDGMAMTPAMRLSAFSDVVVSARVSKSGEAMPQPGDLFGETDPISVATDTETSVLIDRIRP